MGGVGHDLEFLFRLDCGILHLLDYALFDYMTLSVQFASKRMILDKNVNTKLIDNQHYTEFWASLYQPCWFLPSTLSILLFYRSFALLSKSITITLSVKYVSKRMILDKNVNIKLFDNQHYTEFWASLYQPCWFLPTTLSILLFYRSFALLSIALPLHKDFVFNICEIPI